MGILDVDPLFINVSFEETIDFCTNTPFIKTKRAEVLSKIEFKELLSLATKEFCFIF